MYLIANKTATIIEIIILFVSAYA